MVDAVAFSPDGVTIASGAWQDHTIRLWDATSGKERRQIALPTPRGMNYGNIPLAFSPDGRLLASGSGDRGNETIYVWEVNTGKEFRRLPGGASGNGSLAFSPDGRTLAISRGKFIELHEVATGLDRGRLEGDDDAGTRIAFSPDGKTLAAGGGPNQPTIRFWDIPSGKMFAKLAGHQGWVHSLAFAPNGSTLASGSDDTTILIWDLAGLPSRQSKPTSNLSAKDLSNLWEDLAGPDAVRVRQAIWELVAASDKGMPFIRSRVLSIPVAEPQQLRQWLKDLDSERFEVRETAKKELENLGGSAAPALRKVLAERPSAEFRRQVEQLLENINTWSPNRLRLLRTLEVLELIGTSETQQIVEQFAKETADEPLKQKAEETLKRLSKRINS